MTPKTPIPKLADFCLTNLKVGKGELHSFPLYATLTVARGNSFVPIT